MENLSDDPKKLRLGWVIYEEVGIAIINDHAISRIDRIDTSDTLSPRVVLDVLKDLLKRNVR